MDKLEGVEEPLTDLLVVLSEMDGYPDRDFRAQVLKALSECTRELYPDFCDETDEEN